MPINDSDGTGYADQTNLVHRLFELQASRSPDVVAVSYAEEQLTYEALNARANQLARRLRGHGVNSEVLVGICLERSVDLVVALLAVLKAGGAYVPLDPAYPAPRLAYMLDDAGIAVLVCTEAFVPALSSPDVDIVRIDSEWPGISLESGTNLAHSGFADGLAYVMYTSGSTGQPKGVGIVHRAIIQLIVASPLDLDGSMRIGQASNSSFDAITFEVWGALLHGGRIIGVPLEVLLSPGELASTIRRERIEAMFLTAELFRRVVREAPGAFGPMELLLVGGEAVDVRAVRDVLNSHPPRRLLHAYGPTESTTFATCHPVDSLAASAASIPVGWPISNTKVQVLDASGQPTAAGVAGELYIAGDGLARGYLGRPGETAEKFVPNPFPELGRGPGSRLYRTGDRARTLRDGSIELMGRFDDQVKVRGLRIEPGEIETALGRHSRVGSAAVVVREDRSRSRRLVAYVTARDGEPLEAAELRRHLQTTLPDYMVPGTFVQQETLPLTPNGKVDREALPAPQADRPIDEPDVVPRGELEAQLGAIWREVLDIRQVGVDDNFFDVGGSSLDLLEVRFMISEALGVELPIVALFEHPSLRALARHLGGRLSELEPATDASLRAHPSPGAGESGAIAIVGLAGRFPGAANPDELWSNLREGVESIRFFHEAELRDAGVTEDLLADPRYVPARGTIAGAELFAASFFGYSPREAEQTDPQQRVFLECAWQALESAGYDPSRYDGLIGVYAGASPSSYPAGAIAEAGSSELASAIARQRDFLPLRVAYDLDLHGPAVNIQTACSTSLVAVHHACRALLDQDCDMALAGGVSVSGAKATGYLYQTSGIASPDGHCRAFDAEAAGTVAGEGVGIVVLKRLEAALSDGDFIHAVIRGTAVNNDGCGKVGFTAPSVEWQARVIAQAQARAGVGPDSIGYVESHGTGTALGDPVEVAALSKIFGATGTREAPLVLGAIKTNIGHLDAAAGVAGLIKTVMALKNRKLVPTLHFHAANPEIDLEAGPFVVNTRVRPWVTRAGDPRRAGVSSFGIGGTNAHAVVEEAPQRRPQAPCRDLQLLVLSARTPSALDSMSSRLADHLETHPATPLADVAYTLKVGRRRFDQRRAVVCGSTDEAIPALRGRSWQPSRCLGEEPGVAFMFPGQGAQYVNMGRSLYQEESAFRASVDRCSELLEPIMGVDLRSIVYPPERCASEHAEQIEHTSLAQPALFVVEYALARQWMAWGIRPVAMIGHSIGEYVAACLAGVMSLEDALAAVAERGRSMGELQPGAMLAVPLAEADLSLSAEEGVSIASINGPRSCVLSGTKDAVGRVAQRLAEQGVASKTLRTSHAFHSPMMEPLVSQFAARMAEVELAEPTVPYVSNVTGDWITPAQATDSGYYARHLRDTVQLWRGLERLVEGPADVLLEVGPGRTMSTLAGALRRDGRPIPAIPSIESPAFGSRSDVKTALEAMGRMWAVGVEPEWSAIDGKQAGRRVELPTYPFERERYWLDAALPSGRKVAVATARPPDRDGGDGEPASPGNDAEATIAGIWQELLGIDSIDVREDFFGLGGHSLLAIQLTARIRESYGVELPLSAVFEARTVQQQAELLGAAHATETHELDALLAEVEDLSPDELRRQLDSEEQRRHVEADESS